MKNLLFLVLLLPFSLLAQAGKSCCDVSSTSSFWRWLVLADSVDGGETDLSLCDVLRDAGDGC